MSNPKEEMFKQRKALKEDGSIEGDMEESPKVQAYLSEEFAVYVDENYVVENKAMLKNSTILQMIYALEWWDIPRSNYSYLIEFHPYLTA